MGNVNRTASTPAARVPAVVRTVECRLARLPLVSNRICTVLRFDKASVSRVLKFLDKKGIVAYEASPTDNRKRRWWLSEKGLKTHDDLLALALKWEEEMIAGIASENLEALLDITRKMLTNLEG